MASLNKVFLLGNVGNAPELKTTQSGKSVSNFSLATSTKTKDGEKTEWHNIVTWNKTAEICVEYVTKGKQIMVEGRIQTRSWEDKEGNKRYSTEVVADNVQFVGPREQQRGDAYEQKAGEEFSI